MQSIVTALDKRWRERAEDVCGELRAIGLKGMRAAARPRFTYQAAERFEAARLELALAGVAAAARKFEAQAAGLGVFAGPEAIVYASIAPSDRLRAMHRLVWDAMLRLGSGRGAAYAPQTWVPHVALTAGAIPPESLADVQAVLARHHAGAWNLRVDNICYVPDVDDPDTDWLRFDLR